MTLRQVVLWMFLGVIAAFGLYMVKFKVQGLKTEVAGIEMQLREEKKNHHVLEAEWTYLNRPERLSELNAKYLDLKPVRAAQLGDLASLPMPGTMTQASSDREESLPRRHTMTLASGVDHARRAPPAPASSGARAAARSLSTRAASACSASPPSSSCAI